MDDPPGRIVAFLFTDIAGSTRLWAEQREEMALATAAHDAILRDAITSHCGAIYKVVGDGLQAAFPSVTDALRAAAEALRRLDEVTVGGGESPEPLRVRMALHAAGAEPDETGDYRTPALNLAGRLLDLAAGGQALASAAFVTEVGDDAPADLRLQPLGALRLRGMPVAEAIAELTDTRRPAPPPDRPPQRGNLPVSPSTIIGRQAEVSRLRLLLRSGETRLVTLTGPGGVGKTRLALEVAQGLGDRFPDGIWFVDLAPVRDPAGVLAAIATGIGARETFDADPMRQIAATLRDQQTLLVLDNLEQLMPDAAERIATLLAQAPSVTLLVTSRTPLAIRAERVRVVDPLPAPPEHAQTRVADLLRYAASRLLIERRQEIDPDVAPDERAAPAIARICARLDGLPLAIELVAARISLDRPEAALEVLSRRLPALADGPRDAPERQRTLAATIAWSYDLLEADTQAAFRALGVAPASLAVEAAAEVAGCDGATIDLLLRQHLLSRAGEGRVRMLETVREFALTAPGAASGQEGARDRLATWTLGRFAPFYGVPPNEPMDGLIREDPNIEASLGWLLERGQLESAARLAVSAYWFWQIAGGRLRRGVAWLERLSEAAEAAPLDPALMADLHLYLAQLHYPTGGGGKVEASLRRCEEWIARAGDARHFFEHRRCIAFDAFYRGRAREALALVQELDRDFNADLVDGSEPLLLYTISMIATAVGRFDLVDDAEQRYRALAGGEADDLTSNEILAFRAEHAALQGREEEALALHTAAAERYAEQGDAFGLAYTAIDRISLCADRDLRQLDGWLAEAEAGAGEIDDLVFASDLEAVRALIAMRHGRHGDAAAAVRVSLDIAIRLPMAVSRIRALRCLALIVDAAGDATLAAWFLGAADGYAGRAGFHPRLYDNPLARAVRATTGTEIGLKAHYDRGGHAPDAEVNTAAMAWRPPATAATGRD